MSALVPIRHVIFDITTVIYFFDESCMPGRITSPKGVENRKLFLRAVQENFVEYNKLDHIPLDTAGKKYFSGLEKFKYGQDKGFIEYKGENKDIAIVNTYR